MTLTVFYSTERYCRTSLLARLSWRRSSRGSAFACATILIWNAAIGDDGRPEASRSPAPQSKTIGFVLSGFDYQFYATKDGKEECPDGYVHGAVEAWRAHYPTDAARAAHNERCSGILNRGPNCESVLVAPELVKDRLPYREVRGPRSFGVNLDGTSDGRETAKTCTHEKFRSLDGKQSDIDNQYYRLLGCHSITHSPSLSVEFRRKKLMDSQDFRVLLEIRGVDDERNDSHVEVVLYRGRDSLVVDVQDEAVPWQTQRIDPSRTAQVMDGRIVNGELITDPTDIEWADIGHVLQFVNVSYAPPVLVRETKLGLKLTDVGAVGMRTGYVDIESWWRMYRQGWATKEGLTNSPPAMREALDRLADGYKETKTAKCTALSSAMTLEFKRAYILQVGQ